MGEAPLRVAGLVLAAGEGRRLGRPKALVELAGERLVDRAVRVLTAAGCEPVTVVAGATPLQVPGARVVTNREWASGMGSSLRAGLSAQPPGVDAVVVSLVDQPGIGPDAVGRVVERVLAGATVAVATYDGRARNPVALHRRHWAAVVAGATGDQGARPFLATHPDLVTSVEVGDLADPADIDTVADLAHFGG